MNKLEDVEKINVLPNNIKELAATIAIKGAMGKLSDEDTGLLVLELLSIIGDLTLEQTDLKARVAAIEVHLEKTNS